MYALMPRNDTHTEDPSAINCHLKLDLACFPREYGLCVHGLGEV